MVVCVERMSKAEPAIEARHAVHANVLQLDSGRVAWWLAGMWRGSLHRR